MPTNDTRSTNRLYIIAFLLLAGPFYVNDFASIYIGNWRWWLFIDYVGLKLFPCLVAGWLIYSKKMSAAQFGLTSQPLPSFLIVFLGVALVGTIIDQNGYASTPGLPGYTPLGGMPAITSPAWNWIDLTLGLFMVGVCEELVFRGFMHTFIRQITDNSIAIVVISALFFGLIHWSQGLQAILITSIIGMVFMIAYLATRSLPAIILAHFAINFIDAAGVIPKTLFKFL